MQLFRIKYEKWALLGLLLVVSWPIFIFINSSLFGCAGNQPRLIQFGNWVTALLILLAPVAGFIISIISGYFLGKNNIKSVFVRLSVTIFIISVIFASSMLMGLSPSRLRAYSARVINDLVQMRHIITNEPAGEIYNSAAGSCYQSGSIFSSSPEKLSFLEDIEKNRGSSLTCFSDSLNWAISAGIRSPGLFCKASPVVCVDNTNDRWVEINKEKITGPSCSD